VFDLPTGRSPLLASSWAKALNYRDFQDKLLRVIQYVHASLTDTRLIRPAAASTFSALYGREQV
jgi:hypothetical protein